MENWTECRFLSLQALFFNYFPYHFKNRDLSNNYLSGILPLGMCSRNFTGGCFIDGGRFTTNCAKCNYLAPLATSTAEFQALNDFYNYTNGGNWVNYQNWLIGDPCISGWFGVTCNSRFAVVSLSLNSNNLTGTLPNSIGNLLNLTKLALSGNAFAGSIPSSVASMTSLTNLTLSNNRLNGSLPTLPAGISYL